MDQTLFVIIIVQFQSWASELFPVQIWTRNEYLRSNL